jgi:Cu/Ag efflux protein CusF
MKRMIQTFLLAAALLLAGCGPKPAADAKRYPMQGVVKSLDARTNSAMIDAGKIGDWMEAMTMEYPVKPEAEFRKLHVGDKIEATVVVGDPGYYVTDIKVK